MAAPYSPVGQFGERFGYDRRILVPVFDGVHDGGGHLELFPLGIPHGRAVFPGAVAGGHQVSGAADLGPVAAQVGQGFDGLVSVGGPFGQFRFGELPGMNHVGELGAAAFLPSVEVGMEAAVIEGVEW